MNNKGPVELAGLFLLLYMTMLIVTSTLFFARPPAAYIHGTVELIAVFSLVLAVMGFLGGKGLPHPGRALFALFLACLLPSWYWLRGACGNDLVVPVLVFLMPLWAARIPRPARWPGTQAPRV